MMIVVVVVRRYADNCCHEQTDQADKQLALWSARRDDRLTAAAPRHCGAVNSDIVLWLMALHLDAPFTTVICRNQ